MAETAQKPLLGSLLDYGDPLAKGLIGCWLLSEGAGGTITDLSGNNNTGTITDMTWKTGSLGHSLLTSSATSAINCGSGLNGLNKFTALFWGNPASEGGLSQGRLFSTVSAGSGWELHISDAGTNALKFVHRMVTTSITIESVDNVFNLNELSCFACTWDGGTATSSVKLYVNGVETGYDVTQAGVGAPKYSSGNFYISTQTGNVAEWDGLIEVAMIYNKVLTASEIEHICREPFRFVGTKRRIRVPFAEAVVAGVENAAADIVSASSVTGGFVRLNRPGAARVASASAVTGGFIRLNRPGVAQVTSASSVTAGMTLGAPEELFRYRRFELSNVYGKRRELQGVF